MSSRWWEDLCDWRLTSGTNQRNVSCSQRVCVQFLKHGTTISHSLRHSDTVALGEPRVPGLRPSTSTTPSPFQIPVDQASHCTPKQKLETDSAGRAKGVNRASLGRRLHQGFSKGQTR